MKPILKWAGGKRWLVPSLNHIWNVSECNYLIEPFTGGMSVALGLNPKQALLNDVNIHLVNFYQQVKKGLVVSETLENKEAYYYNAREKFNALIHSNLFKNKKAACLFYYLIRTGFNGLCRFNSKGEFNVPFGQHKSILYRDHFHEYQSVLSTWQFSNVDFEKLKVPNTGLIYADPPYDVEFTKYYQHDFHWADQIRLVDWLSKHPGPIVASNQATKRIIALYKAHQFHLFYLNAPRSISCNGNRAPAKEILAMKGFDNRQLQAIKRSLKMLHG